MRRRADGWTAFFTGLPSEAKVAAHERMWDACSVDERSRIVQDVAHFFLPALSAAGEDDAAEADGAGGAGVGAGAAAGSGAPSKSSRR